MAKAQVFTWDLMLGTSLFLVVLVGVIFLWNSTMSKIEDAERMYEMSWISNRAGEQLIRLPGIPDDWNETNVEIFGLAETRDLVGSPSVQDRIIDPDKFTFLVNLTANQYLTVRSMLLGTSEYDFYIEFFCKETDCFKDLDLDVYYAAEDQIWCENEGGNTVKIKREFYTAKILPDVYDTCIIGKWTDNATYVVPSTKHAVFSEIVDVTDPDVSTEMELTKRFGMRFVVYKQ